MHKTVIKEVTLQTKKRFGFPFDFLVGWLDGWMFVSLVGWLKAWLLLCC